MAKAPPLGETVGSDLGVEALLTLSNGERIPNVRPASRREREIRVSRRALARCRKGSARRRKVKVKARLARQLRGVANVRENRLHQVSAHLAKTYSLVVLEDMRIANMTRSASVTVAEPGTNVAQKRGLNRSILDAG